MRAVLKYKDYERNHQVVHGTLAISDIDILKFKQGWDFYSKVTIRVKNREVLNNLLAKLNQESGVILVKTMPDSIWDWFKK